MPAADPSDLFSRALAALDRRDVAVASQALRATIALAPSWAEPIGHLAHVALGERLHDFALAWSRRGLAVDSGVHGLHFIAGHAQAARKERKLALQAFRRAQVLAPAFHDAVLNAAILAPDPITSVVQSRRALAVEPASRIALQQLGAAMRDLDIDDQPTRRLLRLEPESGSPYWQAEVRRRRRNGPGYLVIKPWGVGFWGEVDHVAGHLVIAEIMGREPIVLWNDECRYRPPDMDNGWDAYFEPVSTARRRDLDQTGLEFYPPFWTRENLDEVRFRPQSSPGFANPFGVLAVTALGRPEDVVVADGYISVGEAVKWAAPTEQKAREAPLAEYRRLFAERIRPLAHHATRQAAMADRLFERRPVLAVHYRAQSLAKAFTESAERRVLTLDEYLPHIDGFVDRYPGGSIFLLSDADAAVERLRLRYEERLIVLDRLRLADELVGDVSYRLLGNNHRLGLEVFDDVYLAARADMFLGDGASGVSCAIMHVKDWPDDTLTLLRRNVFLHRAG